MSNAWATIITALTSAGAVTLIATVFQALVGRRKLSADAVAVIEESASSAVKRVEADNARLRERVEKIETLLDELRKELRSRDRRIDDLSDDLDDAIDHIRELREELLRQDPTLTLPEPPARIAKHFPP